MSALRAVIPTAMLLMVTSGCPSPAPQQFDAVNQATLDTASGAITYGRERAFPSAPRDQFIGCVRASPLRYNGPDGAEIIVADANAVHGLSPLSGETLWTVIPSAPEAEDPYIVSTPLILGDRLFVLYHTTDRPAGVAPGAHRHNLYDVRRRHLVSAIDLAGRRVDPDFPPVELGAIATDVDGHPVPFLSNNNLGRAQVDHAVAAGQALGNLYLSFGNARDLQPWHGWVFEVSLDAWQAQGSAAAQTSWLVTTPEANCGASGVSGSTSRVCGGGLWAPSGQLIVPNGDSYDIVLAPGNGQLDLLRNDFANTLMRVGPGLDFDTGCDAAACADVQPDDPAIACSESCQNLFIPRLLPGQGFPDPGDGACDDETSLFECWRKLDYIGGSTPVYVALSDGPNLLVYPTKDGHVYLIDADHLGTLYDRAKAADTCGAPGDKCLWSWAGMIVTQPALTERGGRPLVLVPTFVADNTHDAGVVAFAITNDADGPRLERIWEYPAGGTDEARSLFRKHPGRIALARHGADAVEFGWIVDTSDAHRRLHAIDIQSGAGVLKVDLLGKGYRFTQPLVIGDTVYLPSCSADEGPSFVEAYRLTVSSE